MFCPQIKNIPATLKADFSLVDVYRKVNPCGISFTWSHKNKEEGEKPTCYFFRLEIKRAAKNSFASLVDANGVEKSMQSDFENILTSFYTDLFTKDPSIDMQIQTQIINNLKLSLTDLERDSCKGIITTEELFAALKGFQIGKAPGSDGLHAKFYLAFWDDLGIPFPAF